MKTSYCFSYVIAISTHNWTTESFDCQMMYMIVRYQCTSNKHHIRPRQYVMNIEKHLLDSEQLG